MCDPSQDIDGDDAAAELVVMVPEGQLVEVVECGIGRHVERRFDYVVQVAEVQARVQMWVWGQLQVWPEKVLQGSAGVCVVGYYV